MKSLIKTLMEKNSIDRDEALELINTAVEDVNAGEDPDDVLANHFGLEPDWVLDFLEYCI